MFIFYDKGGDEMGSNITNYRLQDIPSYYDWVTVKQVNKGWSKDKKYYIRNSSGEKFLLRISDFDTHDSKRKEFETMEEVYKLGITTSAPVNFGIYDKRNVPLSFYSAVSQAAKRFEQKSEVNHEIEKVMQKVITALKEV